MYITERNKFCDSCSRCINNFRTLEDDDKLKYIMKYELWKVTTWEKRKSLRVFIIVINLAKQCIVFSLFVCVSVCVCFCVSALK